MLNQRNRRTASAGFTLVELLIVVAILGIVLTLAIAGYRHARISAGESSALASLQSINQAQFVFAQTCGDQRYSPTLAGLGVPAPTTGQPFLSPDLTLDPAVKSGYQFVMDGEQSDEIPRQSCNGVVAVPRYRVLADPIAPGASGIRYFGTNTDRAVYADTVTFAEDMPYTGAPGHGAEVR